MKLYATFLLCLMVGITACSEKNESELPDSQLVDTNVYDAFMDNLRVHCGQAFAGSLTLEPPGDTMLEGDELLIVHFRECEEDVLRVPFHIQRMDGTWDRSRTWNFFRREAGLEIRHDHRKPDGSDDDVTWYGGPTHGEPGTNQMEFISHERTEETGMYRGWRIIIEPNVRYTYGTFRDGIWSWRIDFDLSNPVEIPPAPWGHE
jgi:hypothetical protein